MMCASISLESRFTGAYLGLAVGDALGATVEFMTPTEIRTRYGVHRKVCGGGWLNLKPGQVTDDTTMALALGNSILRETSINAHSIAEAFSQWMRNKPVDIGNTVRRGILHFRNTGLTISPESEHDAGNGACMRCLPVALASFGKTKLQVQNASRTQAHITHHNELSDAGTEGVIFLIQESLRGVQKPQLLSGVVDELVSYFPEFDFTGPHCSNPSGYIVETLRAVFQSFFTTNDFENCLIDVVNRGGDADTTGAIAGMLAGSFYGVEAIPEMWKMALHTDVRKDCEYQAMEFYKTSTFSSHAQ